MNDPEEVFVSLTNGGHAVIDACDADLVGGFSWRRYTPHPGISYAITRSEGADILMHRLVLPTTSRYVDHADGNGLNNRRSNLRPATASQNGANQRLRSDNKSGFKGVSYDRSNCTWRATIRVNGRKYHLGRTATPEEAACLYDSAARDRFGEFAKTNFPLPQTQEVHPAL